MTVWLKANQSVCTHEMSLVCSVTKMGAHCHHLPDPFCPKRKFLYSFVGSCQVSTVLRHVRCTQKEYQQPRGALRLCVSRSASDGFLGSGRTLTLGAHRVPHCTHAWALFSLEQFMRDVWLKSQLLDDSVCVRKIIPSPVMSLLGVPSRPFPAVLSSTNFFSDATFRIIYTTEWNQKTPLCHSAVIWPIRLQTHLVHELLHA